MKLEDRLDSVFTDARAVRAASVVRWPVMIARASSGEFAARLDHYRKRVDAELAKILRSAAHVPERLRSAMEYSVLGGGKRVRPLLAYASGELCGVDEDRLDVIATGGTAAAVAKLVAQQRAAVAACVFLIELTFLNGRARLPGQEVISLIRY